MTSSQKRPYRQRAVRPLADRFWEKVRVGSKAECWPWLGSFRTDGYGQISRGRRAGMVGAHRVSFHLHTGAPLDGDNAHAVLHRCDNRSCVNPHHLFTGSRADNNADMWSKGRGAMGFRLPQTKLSEEDVRAIRRARAAHAKLAARFGVSQSTISRIKNRQRRWRVQ